MYDSSHKRGVMIHSKQVTVKLHPIQIQVYLIRISGDNNDKLIIQTALHVWCIKDNKQSKITTWSSFDPKCLLQIMISTLRVRISGNNCSAKSWNISLGACFNYLIKSSKQFRPPALVRERNGHLRWFSGKQRKGLIELIGIRNGSHSTFLCWYS